MGFMGFLIVGCVLLAKLWAKRGRPRRIGKALELVESLSLGGNKFVCLVRARETLVLLGVTDQNVSLIKEVRLESDSKEHSEAPSTASECVDGADSPATSGQGPMRPEGSGFASFLVEEVRKAKKRFSSKGLFLVLATLLVTAALFAPASRCMAAPNDLPIPNIDISIDGEPAKGGLGTSLGILGLLTVLSLAPALVMLTTSFTRMVIVFSFLRSGLGTQQTPPNQVLVGLALILTFFVMTPTWTGVNQVAIQPYIAGSISGQEAFALASEPMKDFMLRETREKDLALFATLNGEEAPATPQEMSLFQIVPAFTISELRTAFEMGFMLYLPFLVIDMVVASTLMSMGMLMLPPVLISLPFKLLLFVLVDGWSLVTKSLIGGFL